MANAALKIDSFATLESIQKQVLTLVTNQAQIMPPVSKPADSRQGLEMGDFAEKYFSGNGLVV